MEILVGLYGLRNRIIIPSGLPFLPVCHVRRGWCFGFACNTSVDGPGWGCIFFFFTIVMVVGDAKYDFTYDNDGPGWCYGFSYNSNDSGWCYITAWITIDKMMEQIGRLRRNKPPRAYSSSHGMKGSSSAGSFNANVAAGRLLCDTYLSAKEFLRETTYRCFMYRALEAHCSGVRCEYT